jgi:hypothetical protein
MRNIVNVRGIQRSLLESFLPTDKARCEYHYFLSLIRENLIKRNQEMQFIFHNSSSIISSSTLYPET